MLSAVQVRDTQLPTPFMRQAYNQSQVNDLIDRIAATLSAYELDMATLPSRAVTASEVLNYRFDLVSFARGYDRLAVNDLLHQAAKALGAWEKRYADNLKFAQTDDASVDSYHQVTEQPTVAVRQATDIN
ncbi:MAG: DivIVA domain-containing protein, partial [Actinomyces graevenitzii]|nr:DivIVA domain-containing protein [Actinomyces graevenitzii]